jgi:lipopolysaccharide cholinephosphotransferase
MTSEQKKLLSLFKEIIDICERHDIVYYMAGGTLIGAMRHKGFIPWDDDMDLLMTRDNWHKFIEATRTDMPENRVLECQELDRDYPNMFGRYTDTTSSAIHLNQILGDGIAGYVVDILVLDPIPDKDETYLDYRDKLLLYSDLVNPSLNYSYRYNVNKNRFGKYYKMMKRRGKDAVLSEIEKDIFSYSEADCKYYVMRWGGAPFLFDKDMYGSSRYGMFEGVQCRIPDRTGDYLTWHYGDDWMHIPHHSEHESHDAIFSFTTNYKTIQKDYLRYIDVDKVRRSIIFRKKYLLRNMLKLSSVKDQRVRILSYATKCDVEQAVKNCGYDIQAYLKEERYNELAKLFEKFFEEQLSRNQIGREDYLGIYRFESPVFCGVSDDILTVATMVLIHTNRIAKAARLIEIREMSGADLPEGLLEAKDLIRKIRHAISCCDLGRMDEAFSLAEELYQEHPKNFNLNMLYIRLLIENGFYEKAEALTQLAIKLYPKEGAFLKFMGDLTYRNDKKKAYEIYGRSFSMTSNGCTHLEIKERTISDKQFLISDVHDSGDLSESELLIKLAGDDVDFHILNYEIRLTKNLSLLELVDAAAEIQLLLNRFDNEPKLLALLHAYFVAMGESKSMADYRTRYIAAQTAEEYHQLVSELTMVPEDQMDGNHTKILGDLCSRLGLIHEANRHWSNARNMACSPLTIFELDRSIAKEARQ